MSQVMQEGLTAHTHTDTVPRVKDARYLPFMSSSSSTLTGLSSSSSSRMISRPSALTLKPWSFLPWPGPGCVAGLMEGEREEVKEGQSRSLALITMLGCVGLVSTDAPPPIPHPQQVVCSLCWGQAIPCLPRTRWATLGSRKLRGSSPPPSFSHAWLLWRASFRCSLPRLLSSSSSSSSSESARISSMLWSEKVKLRHSRGARAT